MNNKPFERDRLTWLMYIMLAAVAYQQGILGPLMPFLRKSLNMSYTTGGTLVTAIAIGMIVTGLISDRIARRIGRRRLFWLGAAGYVIGAWGLALSTSFEFAFGAVLFSSAASAFMIAIINAALSDRHRENRARALGEANVAAAFSAAVSPLLIGLFQTVGLGWQWALFLSFGIMGLIAIVFFAVPIPDVQPGSESASAGGSSALPVAFWVYWLVVISVVAFEWCFVIWGADYLVATLGFEPSLASSAMGIYLGAVVLGRAIGSVLTRRWAATTMLPAAIVLALIGFPLFWLTSSPVTVLLGLGIAGLGVANHFPLTLSIAVGQARGQTTAASARVSMGVGVAIFAAPLLLGRLADQFSIQAAYSIVPIIGAFTLGLLAIAYQKGWR